MPKCRVAALERLWRIAQRDPRLDDYERGFIADAGLRVRGGVVVVSAAQASVLGAIALKLGYSPQKNEIARWANPQRITVIELLAAGRGDTRLSAWEEGFLASIERQASFAGWKPTEKQAAVLVRVAEKLKQPLPEWEGVEPPDEITDE